MAAIDDWMKGDGTDALQGTDSASSIDDNVTTYIQDPLNILNYGYRRLCTVTYASASSVTVSVGEIVCRNNPNTILRMRKMTVSQTCSTLDTGALSNDQTYYVYITADTSDTVFSAIITLSTDFPAGITYARKVASFTTDASNNINSDSLVQEDTATIQSSLGDWVTTGFVGDTAYQADSDGFVVVRCNGGASKVVTGYTDSNATPTTAVLAGSSGTSAGTHHGITMPVKKGDYWLIESEFDSNWIRWIPLS